LHDGPVNVTLLYFDGCPNWHEAERRVRQALAVAGVPADVLILRRVGTAEEAERLAFRGSPTILIDGADPFAEPSAPVGLACRVYRGPDGVCGAPSVEDLTAAFRVTG